MWTNKAWMWPALAALLTACSGPEFALGTTLKDFDGDGYDNAADGGDDCNDSDPEINPGAEELCDGIDNDCDEQIDCADLDVADKDGDGVCVCDDCDDDQVDTLPGNPEVCDGVDNDCNGLVDCADPVMPDGDGDGVCTCADCADTDPTNFPGNPELCDGVDNNCDGVVDNDLSFLSWFEDVDGDGHGDPGTEQVLCAPPSSGTWVQIGDDCDDSDAANHPGNNETCDGLDNNCDGQADEGLSFADLYFDADADGHGDPNNSISGCAGAPGSGWVLLGDDCDDTNDQIHPQAVEACDGIDNDCDTLVDCADPGVPDADADGYCSCDDCNDLENWNFPGNVEICDGRDNNCDGLSDCADPTVGDVDGDGVCACTDCDDSDPAQFPGNPETCDGVDNDCDGLSDCNDPDIADGDGDGVCTCFDCDDADASNFPGNLETCDGLDNDCDGTADDGLTYLDWYQDVDGDLHGDPATLVNGCNGAPGADWVLAGDDCDDADPANFPGNNEACDGQDNDCDTYVDEGLSFDDIYQDIDGDGYGDPTTAQSDCAGLPDPSWVFLGGDCDDADPAIRPDAPEACDGIDNDCDGLADCLDPEVQDADADGYCVCDDCDDLDGANHPGNVEQCDGFDNDCDGLVDCADPAVPDSDGDGACECDDCDDSNPANSPGLPETCDGADNDCDGLSDCLDPDVADGDGDGVCTCFDCDDADPQTYPGASELCDGTDNDCDGTVPPDETTDADSDGFLACEDCDDTCADCFPGAPELCDGLDNDCDATLPADEVDADADGVLQCDDCDDLDPTVGESTGDPDGDGFDECAGDCDNADPAVYPGATEICDVLDNDCDGTVDEGFLVGNRYELFEHCGVCNNDCGTYVFDNATAICDAGLPTPACVPDCIAGWFDANADPADGCECEFLSAIDPEFDGVDADCDGQDGDPATAIHVALWGAPGAAGTRTDPVASVQEGVDLAVSSGLDYVLVAQGVYYESIDLAPGISLVGGYSYFFDDYDPVFFETTLNGVDSTNALPATVNLVCDGSTQRITGFTVNGTVADDPGESSYGLHLTDCDGALTLSDNVVLARSGADGSTGIFGANGAQGVDGSDGLDAQMTSCASDPAGGSGGALTCAAPSIGEDVSGGDGGDTLCAIISEQYAQSGANGSGGALGGAAGSHGLFEGTGLNACTTVYVFEGFGAGAHGGAGAFGTHGSGGAGCSAPGGQVSGGLFVGSDGAQGQVGNNGESGAGGGAGSGAEVPATCSADDVTGGTGGGGGSGGCGGQDGEPGAGAGGSFAVFYVYNSAPASYPVLSGNTFQAGAGGDGGDGGAGGIGGSGGIGGVGGAQGNSLIALAWAGRTGGNGGNGGAGGHGGGGGGGCGGPSYAIYVHGATPAPTYGSGSVLGFAGAGIGGDGGYSPGAADGTPGLPGTEGATNF